MTLYVKNAYECGTRTSTLCTQMYTDFYYDSNADTTLRLGASDCSPQTHPIPGPDKRDAEWQLLQGRLALLPHFLPDVER